MQEAPALAEVMQAFPGCHIEEVGLCRLDLRLLPPEWGFAPCSLPPIGASPDAMIRHAQVPAAAAAARGGAAAAAAAAAKVDRPAAAAAAAVAPWDIDGLIARLKVAGTTGGEGGSGGGAKAGRCLEVVELKNTSPFRHSRRSAGRVGGGMAAGGGCDQEPAHCHPSMSPPRLLAAEEARCARRSLRWLTEALGSM